MAAAALRLPTLLFSGGQSPFMTRRVELLAAIMDGVQIHHLPDAGHMLPLSARGSTPRSSAISPSSTSLPAAPWPPAGEPLKRQPGREPSFDAVFFTLTSIHFA